MTLTEHPEEAGGSDRRPTVRPIVTQVIPGISKDRPSRRSSNTRSTRSSPQVNSFILTILYVRA